MARVSEEASAAFGRLCVETRGHQDELNGRDFYVTMNCRADVLANGAAVNKQSSNRKLDDAPALTAKIDEFSRFQPADLKTVADLIVKQPPLI